MTAEHARLQQMVWNGSLPLEIRLAAADCRLFEDSDSYHIQHPRQSYLGLLLARLHSFFAGDLINTESVPHDAWLEYEGVPLKWHYPLGLLYDLYFNTEPITAEAQAESTVFNGGQPGMTAAWKLTIHYSDFPSDQLIPLDEKNQVLLDAFINNVKEADYIRNGTARTVMSLSKDDSDKLWQAVQTHDLGMFNSINNKLLNPRGLSLKHIPLKVYLPTSATSAATETIQEEDADEHGPRAGHFKVVQTLVSIQASGGQFQTVGTALHSMMPELFPSRRNPLHAQPVLHGAILPMSVKLDDLMRTSAYLDGFLHLTVVMLG